MTRTQFMLALFMTATLFGAMGCDDDDDDDQISVPVADLALADVGARGDTGVAPDAGGPGAAAEVVSCGSVTPDVEVGMQNIAFVPASSTISAGQVIRWTNNESVPHTVTSGNPGDANAGDLFDSGNLNNGDTFCVRFNQTGSYEYWCRVHPTQMDNGLVTAQ